MEFPFDRRARIIALLCAIALVATPARDVSAGSLTFECIREKLTEGFDVARTRLLPGAQRGFKTVVVMARGPRDRQRSYRLPEAYFTASKKLPKWMSPAALAAGGTVKISAKILRLFTDSLLPAPLRRSADREIARIYKDLWENPETEPAPADRRYLEQSGHLKDYEKTRREILASPRIANFRSNQGQSIKSFVTNVGSAVKLAALGLTFVLYQSMLESRIDPESLLDDPRMMPNEKEIQMFAEHPLGSVSIRIGDSVYSLKSNSSTDVIQQTVKRFFEIRDDGNPARIVLVATLRTSTRAIAGLRRDLLDGLPVVDGHRPFVNDSSLRMMKAVRRQIPLDLPKAFDPAPSLVLSHLAYLRQSRDPSVKFVGTIDYSRGMDPTFQVRAWLSAYGESALYLRASGYKGFLKQMATGWNEGSEDHRALQREVDAVHAEFRKVAQASIDTDAPGESVTLLRKLLDEEIAELSEPDLEEDERFMAQARREALEVKLREARLPPEQ